MADRNLPRSEQGATSGLPRMNSSFGTTVARHRRPHFRHCLASEPLADQLCTSRFGEREISTAIYWGLLKQPDNQKTASFFVIGYEKSLRARMNPLCPPQSVAFSDDQPRLRLEIRIREFESKSLLPVHCQLRGRGGRADCHRVKRGMPERDAVAQALIPDDGALQSLI